MSLIFRVIGGFDTSLFLLFTMIMLYYGAEYNAEWNNHKIQIMKIKHTLLYVDNNL